MPKRNTGPVYVNGSRQTAADIQSAAHCRALVSRLEADIRSIDATGEPLTREQTTAKHYRRKAIAELNLRLQQLTAE